MYSVSGTTITLSRGDTMKLTFGSGKTDWGANDRAIVTIKNASGTVVLKEIHTIKSDGTFDMSFQNSTTDTWPIGTYTYDVRYVMNPVYDTAGVNIIEGDAVITPAAPAILNIINTVGEV